MYSPDDSLPSFSISNLSSVSIRKNRYRRDIDVSTLDDGRIARGRNWAREAPLVARVHSRALVDDSSSNDGDLTPVVEARVQPSYGALSLYDAERTFARACVRTHVRACVRARTHGDERPTYARYVQQ